MKQFIKLTPIFLLAGIVIQGVDILIAAPLVAVYATIICMIIEKAKLSEVIDSAINSSKGAMLVFFIMMLAYAVAEIFMITGVGATIIETSLAIGVTGRSVAVVTFLVTCILSVSTGTSWGTYAACIPIFLWLSHIVGGDPALTMCAAAGGAAFGDNIALISDTTIFSSGLQDVNIGDRVRHQGVWSLGSVALSTICFYVAGLVLNLPVTVGAASEAIKSIPPEAWVNLEAERPSAVALLNQVMEGGTPIFMIIPVIIVIGMAIMKMPTIVCLFAGIFSASLLGALIGTMTSFGQFIDTLGASFSDAGSWVIIMMMWVVAFGGIMSRMNAFLPIANFFVRISKKVRHLMTCNAFLCIIGNMLLSDEVAQMATIGPVIKNIVDQEVEGSEEAKYTLRLRNATFSDGLGVMGAELIPWHVCSIYYVGMATAVYPLFKFTPIHLIQYNFFCWISIVSLIILTFTGWDRFIPLLKTPQEPEVKLVERRKKLIS
ncbi:MAG: Na+/H+ antiporter NhaC family protein [Peptostreptococcaceae bacterium]|nr:Na+/H+ antiporter NhaC family protein [Peptostreptococcaceae bacterium]